MLYPLERLWAGLPMCFTQENERMKRLVSLLVIAGMSLTLVGMGMGCATEPVPGKVPVAKSSH